MDSTPISMLKPEFATAVCGAVGSELKVSEILQRRETKVSHAAPATHHHLDVRFPDAGAADGQFAVPILTRSSKGNIPSVQTSVPPRAVMPDQCAEGSVEDPASGRMSRRLVHGRLLLLTTERFVPDCDLAANNLHRLQLKTIFGPTVRLHE